MRLTRHVALVVAAMVFTLMMDGALAQSAGWQSYKSHFLQPDGRIIDTANHNVSHTEGQGFSMVLAVNYNDRPTFDALLKWSNDHLYRKDIGLYSWRYDPAATPPVSDLNNASDGDTLIAWALLLAGQKWHEPSYIAASNALQAAIIKHNVIYYAGYNVLLPGVSGFNHNSFITLNPSYFIFPAWQAFYQHSHLKIWNDLTLDGYTLLGNMRFGNPRLPTDWVTLWADKTLSPSDRWPARFSYDAVRIPLYINWAQRNSPALGPYVAYWRQFNRLSTPAWVDVLTNAIAPYMLTPGLMAIRDSIMGDGALVSENMQPKEDYYSASLRLLTFWSLK
ncbi:glycosyl hydrolase family 8 [Acerihabitans sp. TG2]|uniref:glycosyl hydrolase family 8 n=1 Tax=Acerihabitans sp. TG2 TaxID=3096008 RepID=UPI002B237DAC|nr:glycosyl hydrolase family 8 [Acerihabitans sp. TG2]MEA9389917.1 glycosyl hydrolase family 8 [Acerihabitans sp. TG2]